VGTSLYFSDFANESGLDGVDDYSFTGTYFNSGSNGMASKYFGMTIFVFGEVARISCMKDGIVIIAP
jgi:hypothetical protein